ncbi:hypothetical protein I302_106478 [Kwoniella bestiolae CBS 10118]|uniref:Protein CPL1-like domain-containing protein n=1 Tax=Kwoniella bestiolae CBS 10118 TaxID=1296100 RepID=A0A1B9G1A4_9TREE|nr:hypothetical protein I302_06265 [Kwoniella bestiolae CBS 10118]OCF24804.1 hypothetical protein I302_06265 [Kwoniella bestiolae CBS 10118]
MVFRISGLSLPLVGLLAFLTVVSAYSETYVGCSSIGAALAGDQVTATSIAGCNAACAAAGYTYAYFANPDSNSNYCGCFSEGPASGGNRDPESGFTDCGNDQSTVYALATDYNFIQCYSSPSSDDTTSQITNDACWDHCKTYTNALFQYASNHFNCICSNVAISSDGSAETCSRSAYFAYSHTPFSSPSLADRRRRRLERMKREQLVMNRFCPSGLEACKVPGSEDSFECIDTSSELESCGGCLYGSYTNATASAGIDCSILTGAALGGTTCSAGRCEISACQDGFKLVEGRCH